MDLTIHKWAEIKDKFTFDDTLILGNGASIAVDSRFGYSSLFEKAKGNILSADVESIFKEFNTKDFELVLKKLRQTEQINKALNINDNDKIAQTYSTVRKSLIQAVHNNHADFISVQNELYKIREFIKNFKTVFSLNYDLIVYWSIMLKNPFIDELHEIKDCFTYSAFDPNWQKFYRPINSKTQKVTLVFYPHGNLILATNKSYKEYKIAQGNGNSLLDKIMEKWEKIDDIPLFVSEGTSMQKLKAIRRSDYLNTVFDEGFRSIKGNVITFGWRMAEQDEHIVERIFKDNKNINIVAVSIYAGNREREELGKETSDLYKKITRYNQNVKVIFFDAGSTGI